MVNVAEIKQIPMNDYSPEKAGVGGSIPSLATIFNNLRAVLFAFGCNWLHFRRASLPQNQGATALRAPFRPEQ